MDFIRISMIFAGNSSHFAAAHDEMNHNDEISRVVQEGDVVRAKQVRHFVLRRVLSSVCFHNLFHGSSSFIGK